MSSYLGGGWEGGNTLVEGHRELVRYFVVVFIWFGVCGCVCVCVTQGELHLLSAHSVPGTVQILGTQK